VNDSILFFDIETTADLSAVDSIEVKPPSNYKDPEKIAAFIEEAKAEAISKMALDPDLGKVIAISYKEGDDETKVLTGDEKEMLTKFWNLHAEHMGRVCGYNIIGFDIPFLMRRSMFLGVQPLTIPVTKKYSTFPAMDLMGIMFHWEKAKSLKWVVRRYSIPNPLPELNGSMVDRMDQETLEAYAKNDVDLVYHLYKKMDGIYF
jgi:predicted PolB exonuclease-like 3'-5' exonuclease